MNSLDPRRQLGQTVRSLREAQAISQEQLAFTTGLHRTYIGSIERGERNLALRNIVKIANALGISAADLLARAGL